MNEQSLGDKNVSQHVTEGRDIKTITELPWWLSGKESACQSRRHRFDPSIRKIPWRRKQQPTPEFLPAKSHEQKSLASYSPWSSKESDMT